MFGGMGWKYLSREMQPGSPLFRKFIKLLHGLVEAVFDVVIRFVRVGFLVEHCQRDVRRFAGLEETAGAHGFDADTRAVVLRLRFEQRERGFDAIAPVAKDARGGGTDV